MTQPKDHTQDHVLYCRNKNTASLCRFTPADKCPTCQAYEAGYVEAMLDATVRRKA